MKQGRNNQPVNEIADPTEKEPWNLSPWEDKLSKITYYFRQQKHCSQVDSINRFTSTISHLNNASNALISERKEKQVKKSSPITKNLSKDLVGNKLKQAFSEHRCYNYEKKQHKSVLNNRFSHEANKQNLNRRKESIVANLENERKKSILQQNQLNANRFKTFKKGKPLRNSIPKLPKIQVFWM